MCNKLSKILFAALVLSSPLTCLADRITEQEQLTRLNKELSWVAAYVQRMQDANSGDGDGLVFRYDLLEQELKGMKQGINDHLRMLEDTPQFARIQQLPKE